MGAGFTSDAGFAASHAGKLTENREAKGCFPAVHNRPFARIIGRSRATTEVRPLASSFPDHATLEGVLDVAARAPSSGNLQPWRWRVDGAAVHLYADWHRQAGGSPTDRRDVLLGCGAVLDHCAVAFAAAGWSPRVRRFPDGGDRFPGTDSGRLAILEVVEQPPNAAHLELAAAISRRRADLRRYPDRPIPPATVELLVIRAARLGVELGVVPRSRWVRHEDGRVALRFADDEGEPDDDAVLLVLGTREDNDAMRLRAGEALSHITLTATAMGLATCPLTEPLNDMLSRLELACEVFDGEAHPQALIRLGLPPTDDVPEPMTERRSVDETTEWTRRQSADPNPSARTRISSVRPVRGHSTTRDHSCNGL